MGHRGSVARGERGHGASSFLILSRFGKRTTVSPSMVSAATRSRAPKLLVRSPLTATRSKSRPNNASRDYLWIKKGDSFCLARRDKGWGTKRVVSQTSNKDIQMRPLRADRSVPRSPIRLLLPRNDTIKYLFAWLQRKKGTSKGGREESAVENERKLSFSLVWFLPPDRCPSPDPFLRPPLPPLAPSTPLEQNKKHVGLTRAGEGEGNRQEDGSEPHVEESW